MELKEFAKEIVKESTVRRSFGHFFPSKEVPKVTGAWSQFAEGLSKLLDKSRYHKDSVKRSKSVRQMLKGK